MWTIGNFKNMNIETMGVHIFLKFPMVHISPIQFNGQIHPPWTIVTFKKMNMAAMLEHAWLQCSCFLNFPMIQISPIHSNGQLHPPWRHTNQEDNYTLCWYVFKAGELNHWKIQKNMNTLLCSGLKVSARSLAWLPSLFNLKSTSKLPTYLLTSASDLTSPHSVWLSPWPPYVYLWISLHLSPHSGQFGHHAPSYI